MACCTEMLVPVVERNICEQIGVTARAALVPGAWALWALPAAGRGVCRGEGGARRDPGARPCTTYAFLILLLVVQYRVRSKVSPGMGV